MPHGAINDTFLVVFADDNVPQQLPGGYRIPPGASVAVAGRTAAGANVAVARVARYQDELLAGLGRVILPDGEAGFPVDHLGQLWAMGKKDDGLVISISGGALS